MIIGHSGNTCVHYSLLLIYNRSNDFVNIYSYFDKFEVNYTMFYDLTLFIHVVKLEMYESKIKGKL
jgi:hypothetical protein